MTPGARIIAATELLDLIIAAAQSNGPAADTLISRYFATRRYAGSKDRRAIRDHVYDAIRMHARPPESGKAAMDALTAGDMGTADALVMLDWLRDTLAAPIDDAAQAALLGRAPLHVRINALRTTRTAMMTQWPDAQPLDSTRFGLALPTGTQVERSDPWQDGMVEVQDVGSQIIVDLCNSRPGMTVVDLCAGAGGKTLALAADMAGEGRLIAADVNRDRLARLHPRAQRAGAHFIETLLLDGSREQDALRPLVGQCDVVLVDAPCTGMGTWRRNPEARWRLTPDYLARMEALQVRVLDLAAPLVRPGGTLVYAVCSLLDPEGRAQVDAFLARHAGWSAFAPTTDGAGLPWGAGRLLTPGRDDSDGFFVARLGKAC